MPRRSRAPNCTHVYMDRVFGRDQQCHVCGLSPSVGFLYECKQDCAAESLHDLLSHNGIDLPRPAKSELRLDLEELGFSKSIILTAEGGHYTHAQLSKLKELKLELRQTIDDLQQASQTNAAMARLTTIAKAPSNNDGSSKSKTKDLYVQACAFKACHTCRPYYGERVYIHFGAVLSADFPPMTREDIQDLPTKSSKVMRTIGKTVQPISSSTQTTMGASTLPSSYSFVTSTNAAHTASSASSTDSSELTFKTSQTDKDMINAQRHPRRRFYKMGRRSSGEIARDLTRLPTYLTRQGLKSAVQSIFRPARESSSSGSNITLPLPRTGTARDLNDSTSIGEWDVGALRRVRMQKERNDLENGTYTGGFEGVRGAIMGDMSASAHRGEHADAVDNSGSKFSLRTCATKGSEVKVNGGVALTEEAVERATSDIIYVDVGGRTKPLCQAVEVEDDAVADIGLQSIMTQV